MTILSLLSALLLGAAVVRRIPCPLYAFERVAMGVVLGLFSWTWLVFIMVLVLPYDLGVPLTIMVSIIATFVLWPGGNQDTRALEGGRTSWIVWAVTTAATIPILGRLFWTHSLTSDSTGIWSGGAAWADYGVHAAIISHIAAATSLPTDLPVASGEKLTYPFLIDLLSAMQVQAGASLHASLFWPGILLVLAVCQLLISFGLRLFGRISVGVGGLGLALTIGSAAGLWQAWGDWRDSGKGFFSFLGNLPGDYTSVPDSNANVTNFLVDALLPQRSILFGFGVGLIVLTLLHVSRDRDDKKLLWPAAVLVGLLPLAHPHSFMITFGLLLFFTAEAAWKTRQAPIEFLKPLGLAFLIALPQLAWQQFANDHGTGGRFRFGWMVQGGDFILGYWWANFGLMLLAFIAIPIVMRKDKRVIWFLPMLVVLFVTQVYAFQPFEYDNLKLIYWVLVIAGFYVAYIAGELIRRHKAFIAPVVIAGIIVVTPGVLSIKREFQLHDQFASPADKELATWVKQSTPVGSVFATSDRPNQPVSTLAGRTLVMGYAGWLYNYSIPYDKRAAAIRAGMAGNFSDPGLKEFGADYLLVGASEDPSWGADNAALSKQTPVWSNSAWRVYKLN